MDTTILCNDDGSIVFGSYAPPSGALLSLNADTYTPGSATWSDQSGNGLDFTVSTDTNLRGVDSDGFPFMDFSGSYGIAKRIVGGVLTTITEPTTNKYTIFCVTRILNSTSTWRTLIRGTSDHTIIINETTNNLGLWDANGLNFVDSGFDITTDMTNSRNLLVWELSTTSPIYNFQLNESGTNATITSATNYLLPFSCVGGHHNDSANMTNNSQYWGSIYEFIVFDGHLTASERKYMAEYLAYKWGIPSKLPTPLTDLYGLIIINEFNDSSGALDELSSAVYEKVISAYALRRLFIAYSGPQIRIRRSTDNTEIDVYFDKYGQLRDFDLDTWLGAATGYVVTWYDQGPGGRHTTGYGTTLPSIYKRTDGLYVIYFNGTSTTAGGYFNAGSTTFNVGSNGGVSAFSRVNFLTGTEWERVYDYGSGQWSNNILLARINSALSTRFSVIQGSTEPAFDITNAIIDNTWQTFSYRLQGSGTSWTRTGRIDGTQRSTSTTTTAYTDRTVTRSYIGRSNWSADWYANMYLACNIFFNTGSITDNDFSIMENAIN